MIDLHDRSVSLKKNEVEFGSKGLHGCIHVAFLATAHKLFAKAFLRDRLFCLPVLCVILGMILVSKFSALHFKDTKAFMKISAGEFCF